MNIIVPYNSLFPNIVDIHLGLCLLRLSQPMPATTTSRVARAIRAAADVEKARAGTAQANDAATACSRPVGKARSHTADAIGPAAKQDPESSCAAGSRRRVNATRPPPTGQAVAQAPAAGQAPQPCPALAAKSPPLTDLSSRNPAPISIVAR